MVRPQGLSYALQSVSFAAQQLHCETRKKNHPELWCALTDALSTQDTGSGGEAGERRPQVGQNIKMLTALMLVQLCITVSLLPSSMPAQTSLPIRSLCSIVHVCAHFDRRYRQDTVAARQISEDRQEAAAPQPVQEQQQLQQPEQAQQRLLQGCNRLKLQLPLPVASDAPPGEPRLFTICGVIIELGAHEGGASVAVQG